MRYKKIIINLFLVLIIIILVLIRIKTDNETTKFFADALSLSIFGILFQMLIEYIYDYSPKLLFQSLIYRNKSIRVSFAYLFRIKVDGVYFLIRGNKVKKFQPVGGVYQYYNTAKAEIDSLFESFDKMKEHSIENQNDIRGYVDGKNLRKFIYWFDSRKNREVNCNREFVEELIATSILDGDTFKNLDYRYIGSHHNGIFKTERQGYEYQYLIADIFEVLLSKEQLDEFRKLKKEFDNESDVDKLQYAFVTKDEIKRKRLDKTNHNNHTDNITDHSFKILEEVEDGLQ